MIGKDYLKGLFNIEVTISGLLIISILSYISFYNYLLFHTLVEGFCIIVASLVYVMASKTYRHSKNDFLLFLGMAYLFIAFWDFLHLITYQGVGIIKIEGANIPTQLWIAARYLEACSLLIAPLFIKKRVHYRITFIIYIIIVSIFTIMIMGSDLFPDCYVTGVGLTPFKILSEYVVCLLIIGGALQLYRQRRNINHYMYVHICSAMACVIVSELCFTLYVDVYGIFNLLGHVLKLISYYLIYRGIIKQGLEVPYDMIFTQLNKTMNQLFVTNEKLATQHKKLEKVNYELRKNDKLKSEMLSNINHELKSPLSAIIAFTELLQDEKSGPLNDIQKDYLNEVADSSNELINRVNEIMHISKVQAGKISLQLDSFDIREVVNSTVKKIKPQFDKKEITITVQFTEQLSDVFGDREKIGQIITNLLSNALKFTPRGGVVGIDINEDLNLKMINITIEDNGIGIAPENHEAVFQLFYQVDGTSSRDYGGSGIGLALVKSLVELQGGKISLSSAVGKGSRFSFTLPL